MTDVNITWLIVALMVGIIIGNANIETPSTDDIPSLIGKILDIIKNEPLECPVGYYKVFADGFEPTGDEWSSDPDGSYVMCEKFKPVYMDINNDGVTNTERVENDNTYHITFNIDESKMEEIELPTYYAVMLNTSNEIPFDIYSGIPPERNGVLPTLQWDELNESLDEAVWVYKPIYSGCLPVASIIDENNTKLGNVFLLDHDGETVKNMSRAEIISITDNTSTADTKNIVFENSTVLIEF